MFYLIHNANERYIRESFPQILTASTVNVVNCSVPNICPNMRNKPVTHGVAMVTAVTGAFKFLFRAGET